MVKTLSLMEKNNITHRDVKPQNILLIKGMYKLCDFGETKIISGVGPILQAVRGSELYICHQYYFMHIIETFQMFYIIRINLMFFH